MLAPLPFPFAHHLDAGAIDQKVERATCTIGGLHVELLLTPAQRRVIGSQPLHLFVKPDRQRAERIIVGRPVRRAVAGKR